MTALIETTRTATLVAATLAAGLLAGLFYAFTCAVMPGLRGSADRTFVDGMQRINAAILNPWFMLSFLGVLVLTAAAAVLQFSGGTRAVLVWVVAALVLAVATLVITGVVNVPLNNALAAAGPVDAIADLAEVRARFEAAWVRWNLVRTVTSTGAFGCLVWALVLHGRLAPHA
ncbi:anthrone oxygenase family protein [Goodfellowiella coeruleoviolacea]|nr:anthrone oxygenase family protein [Goodfellowiella coeruleoviolacea]